MSKTLELSERLKKLKSIIEEEVFIRPENEIAYSESGIINDWYFDFKRVILRVEVLDLVADIFWDIVDNEYKGTNKIQIGCLETTGISIVTSFILKKYKEKNEKVNGFFIRKSRKRDGFLRMVEGCEVTNDLIILVDDSMNSGASFTRQIEVLESLGKKVQAVFTITRFRDKSFYTYLNNKNITIFSLFELNDFKETLGTFNLTDKKTQTINPFIVEWLFKSSSPVYFLVNPKSAPVLDDDAIYFGSDSGYFWALSKATGAVIWKYKVFAGAMGPKKKGKHILSTPLVHDGVVYFGAYDGNVYALDTKTGKPVWINFDADWIGSSPEIAEDLSLLYVGLEFGLFNKQGGISAIDIKTGQTKWRFIMKSYTHSSPKYSKKNNIVICGSEDGIVYGFNAKTGKVIWECVTNGAVKASFSLSEDEKYVSFGSFDTYIYVLETVTGKVFRKWETGNNIYSDPLFYRDFLYMGCTDKMVYCFNYKTGDRVWEYKTNGRIFASPYIIKENLYIGSNDGVLYQFDLSLGKVLGAFQSVERIVNKIAYDDKDESVYLPTFANELYKLKFR